MWWDEDSPLTYTVDGLRDLLDRYEDAGTDEKILAFCEGRKYVRERQSGEMDMAEILPYHKFKTEEEARDEVFAALGERGIRLLSDVSVAPHQRGWLIETVIQDEPEITSGPGMDDRQLYDSITIDRLEDADPHLVADMNNPILWMLLPKEYWDVVIYRFCGFLTKHPDDFNSIVRRVQERYPDPDSGQTADKAFVEAYNQVLERHPDPWGESKLIDRSYDLLKPGGALFIPVLDESWHKFVFGEPWFYYEEETGEFVTYEGEIVGSTFHILPEDRVPRIREYLIDLALERGFSEARFENMFDGHSERATFVAVK